MKKLFWALLLTFTAVSFTACDELKKLTDPDNEDQTEDVGDVCDECGQDPCVCEDETCPDCGKNPCECDTPNPDFTPLQPSQQKAKIAEVGQKLIDRIPASEWEAYAQLAEDFATSAYTSEDYDWGSAEEWFAEQYNKIYKEDVKLTVSGNKYTNEWISEIVILMSNHKGLFTLTENGLVISDYKGGTKVVFTLNGKNYEAEIAASGKVTEAKYVWEDYFASNDDYYYDPERDEWVSTDGSTDFVEDIDRVSFTVGVPEQIKITLKENGASLADITMKFTASFSKAGINLTTDSFSVKTTVSINGFEVVSDKTAYDGAKGNASFKTGFRKNGEDLFSTSASAGLKLKVVEDTYEYEGDYYEVYKYSYVTVEKAQDINVSMDILGEIQAKGSCTNALEASESLGYMWEALYEDNTANVSEAKRHLDNFNAKLNINVYYDGNDTKQASIQFDLASHSDYDWVYYDLIPVIVFPDGSKYKIEEFFTENAFGEFVDSFYELCESFDEVFGFSIEVPEDNI